MRRISASAFSLAFAVSSTASAQRTDLSVCVSTALPQCVDVVGGAVQGVGCDRLFEGFHGRIAWWPLQCVGSITIAVENIAIWNTLYPIYVEVVPLRDPIAPCDNDPGFLVFTVRGIATDCGGWETSSPIDITRLLPVGSFYALRLYFFDSPLGESPTIDCVRVTTSTSEVARASWGQVKVLYR